MKVPGTFVIAIALLTAGAPVAPANCCAPKNAANQAVRAMDCCDSMVDCPTAPQASFAVVSVENSAAEAMPLLADVPTSAEADRVVTRSASAEALLDKPPLYRLHAQLLI